jgi:hypothetical protein
MDSALLYLEKEEALGSVARDRLVIISALEMNQEKRR